MFNKEEYIKKGYTELEILQMECYTVVIEYFQMVMKERETADIDTAALKKTMIEALTKALGQAN